MQPLDAPRDDEFAAIVRDLEISPDGLTRGETPGGRPFAVWVPNRRRDRAVLLVPERAAEPSGAVESVCRTAVDLLAVGDADLTMQEYCAYLGQSYENMAMVYRLVRSMGDIASASQIVEESLRNMVETLDCDWVAAVFGGDADLLGELGACLPRTTTSPVAGTSARRGRSSRGGGAMRRRSSHRSRAVGRRW